MLNVVVLGNSPVAAAHAAVFSRLVGVAVSTSAETETVAPNVAGLVDICVPASAQAGALQRQAGQGGALLVTPPLAVGVEDVERIFRTVKRRHGRLAVTHSLRFHPAFARIKEIVSGGVLGAIRQVTLHRRWCRGAGEAAGDIAAILAFQDLDFCHWLLDGTAVLPAVLDAAAAADSEACRLRYPAAAVVDLSAQRAAGGGPRVWREVNVECGLGEIACRVISASWMGDAPDAVERCDLTRAGAVRHLTVPRAIPLGVELGYRVGALERGETWLCPTPAETRTELALTAAAGWR